ncbi:bifunctional 3'-5' exonuclease/DNA polymerase [Microbacterium sp. CIAB417]|uniref:bifunctional 3'-5' exonuclease/DNA polymerase n=1 Tax=Microbacterium sp. CIAB417 TaxID=2860287 RepID=UPI001FABC64A|nr:bifunctional 3'-5' exonuclease/DNA polymerase [Microbacterium sp. CIAB417]
MPRSAERRIALVATEDGYVAIDLDREGAEQGRHRIAPDELAGWTAATEAESAPRWVIRSARELYPELLHAGARLTRTHDLVLCHAILRDTALLAEPLPGDEAWSPVTSEAEAPTLFDALHAGSLEDPVGLLLEQYRAQLQALSTARDGRLELLCAAESAGGLVAEEMRAAGLPWDAAEHERILVDTLGERRAGGVPARMAELAYRVRTELGDARVNLDSQPKLLRALHRVGVLSESTSRWELAEHDHPAVPPLLAYKKLSRLLSANGWAWLAEWVRDGRFRPVYIPGGVVTGRWASAGGGALQLPRLLRPAVRADPGWMLVVADVAQLEPRMLAAMAADQAMAEAARGNDLYAGVVESGAVDTREEAKYAVLGAMYGATTGDSGRLVPRLRRVFPRAMRLVDEAARIGEDGGVVSTWLGRTSPRPPEAWRAGQAAASGADASTGVVREAQRRARERGRFTRNFVVQGTAAEWSLIWLAEIRHRLRGLPPAEVPAAASGPFANEAHLAFFLHDEVILHVPAESAEQAAEAVHEAAVVATRRLFGSFPLDVPLDLRVTRTAEK